MPRGFAAIELTLTPRTTGPASACPMERSRPSSTICAPARPRGPSVEPRCEPAVAIRGRAVHPARGAPVGLDTLARGTVDVASCDGSHLAVAASGRYELVTNRRGAVKLVDRTTGKRIARHVVAITAR